MRTKFAAPAAAEVGLRKVAINIAIHDWDSCIQAQARPMHLWHCDFTSVVSNLYIDLRSCDVMMCVPFLPLKLLLERTFLGGFGL